MSTENIPNRDSSLQEIGDFVVRNLRKQGKQSLGVSKIGPRGQVCLYRSADGWDTRALKPAINRFSIGLNLVVCLDIRTMEPASGFSGRMATKAPVFSPDSLLAGC